MGVFLYYGEEYKIYRCEDAVCNLFSSSRIPVFAFSIKPVSILRMMVFIYPTKLV
jgi:hypothetical protein